MDVRFNDEFHATIPAVEAGLDRPHWSVVIPTHNCARYLALTLRSVLDQDPGPQAMEILVVDDCSTEDDPEAVVEALGGKRVRFIRQPTNLGKVRNYETGLRAATGVWIHQLHGDDYVRPGFYERMGALLATHPEAGAGFCRSIYIDENGKWLGMTGIERYADGILPGFAARIAVAQRIQTAAMVVRRDVYERLGAFDRRLNCMEDWEMWIRIAVHYPVAFLNEVLAVYRGHPGNATASTWLDGSVIETHQRLLRIVDGYLDGDVARQIAAPRRLEQALFFVQSAASARCDDGAAAGRALRYALRLSIHPRVLWGALRVRAGSRRPGTPTRNDATELPSD